MRKQKKKNIQGVPARIHTLMDKRYGIIWMDTLDRMRVLRVLGLKKIYHPSFFRRKQSERAKTVTIVSRVRFVISD